MVATGSERLLRVLVVHNRYQQAGGEDAVRQMELELMTAAGHELLEYSRDNQQIASNGLWEKAKLPWRTMWSSQSYRELKSLLERERPQVAHFHNIFPLISPAAYYACQDSGVPVVQTLHNYRMFCPPGSFFRRGRPCEECVEHSLWRGVRYGCYRDSRAATATTALMLAVHRGRGTWNKMVNLYIALSEFARRKFIAGGLTEGRILVKPNFVDPDPGERDGAGDYALFVGRLSEGKGLETLMEAWKRLGNRVPLRIAGDGPLQSDIRAAIARHHLLLVSYEGLLAREEVLRLMKGARMLIFPSELYENFPMVLVESFACGVPVIASRLGATEETVDDGRTGLHFTPGDPADLAEKAEWAWTHPERMTEMGRKARAEYEAKYTAERNYQMLMDIYERAIASHRGTAGSTAQGR